MNKFLLTLAFFGLVSITFSCSESDTIEKDPEVEESEDPGNDTDVEEDEDSGNDTDVEEDDDTEVLFTDCISCPGFTLEQTTASGNNETIVVEAAEVCKGEDGKAYLDAILNEDFETYELYLQNRQMFGTRCN